MYKLLIVEDEHLIRKWLRYAVDYEKLGIIVVDEAENGEEGIQKIRQWQPDIVITDINMPIKNAFAMLEETQEFSYQTLIISGYSDFENARLALRYGACDFITKPIDSDELELTLQRIVEKFSGLTPSMKKLEDAKAQLNLPILRMQDECVKQVLDWVHQHYASNETIADIASNLGYSESYIYKKVKEQMGVTINHYRTHYRLKKALDLIASQPQLKIYEVASQIGFSDYAYFNRVFKKYIGVSASEFRDSILE